MTNNINYLVFIWNVFVDTLLLLIVYAWKMYDMQTLHAGGIPMFRGTYLVDDKLTIAIHGDQIDGDDPTNCVYGKTLCVFVYQYTPPYY